MKSEHRDGLRALDEMERVLSLVERTPIDRLKAEAHIAVMRERILAEVEAGKESAAFRAAEAKRARRRRV